MVIVVMVSTCETDNGDSFRPGCLPHACGVLLCGICAEGGTGHALNGDCFDSRADKLANHFLNGDVNA